MNTPETLRASVAACNCRIAELESQYGTGVRPAWVGEEIGIELAWRNQKAAELAELERVAAVDAAIAGSNRTGHRIGRREAALIHRVLKGA